MDKIIPYQRQFIDEDDIKAVSEALRSDFLTTGPKVKEFEEKFANHVNSKYAVAFSSGTAALHLACLTAGLKQGDELITSAITFLASANCALYCNAKPVFVDIDLQGLMDIEDVKEKINEKTKVIIPIHYGGMPVNIKELRENFSGIIVEDSCHALGALYNKDKVGNCKYSDMTIFSFHPVKHITTGEGGMITTNNKEIYEKLKVLRNHGIDHDKKPEQEPWATPMYELGFNYRLTDFQCALGISQLNKLDNFIKSARKIAEKYNQELKNNLNIKIIKEKPEQFNSYHLYSILVKNKEIRLKLYNYLRKNNILVQVHYQPIYLQPYYKNLGYKEGTCPKAEDFYNRLLSLPIYPQLSEQDQNFVINKIKGFFEKRENE